MVNIQESHYVYYSLIIFYHIILNQELKKKCYYFSYDNQFMDRGAWRATVHGIPKSWTQLSDFPFFTSTKVKYTPTFKDLVEKKECEIFQS